MYRHGYPAYCLYVVYICYDVGGENFNAFHNGHCIVLKTHTSIYLGYITQY